MRIPRALIRAVVGLLEGGEGLSLTLRDIMKKFYGVDVGLYTGGGAFVPWAFRWGTKIGRFGSIYWTIRAFDANHPMNFKSTSPAFFNRRYGFVQKDLIKRPGLEIGNDVWMGHNAIVLPTVRKIGDGAVIGAGSVVHKDVPPYAIIVGHPGRIAGYRFSKETIARLLEEQWWNKSMAELVNELDEFCRPLEEPQESEGLGVKPGSDVRATEVTPDVVSSRKG